VFFAALENSSHCGIARCHGEFLKMQKPRESGSVSRRRDQLMARMAAVKMLLLLSTAIANTAAFGYASIIRHNPVIRVGIAPRAVHLASRLTISPFDTTFYNRMSSELAHTLWPSTRRRN